jgi:lipoxygenase
VPGRRGANELCLAPFHHRARAGLKVVAAISEDLPRLAAPGTGTGTGTGTGKGAAEGRRPEKVLVRAALTVRRKHKEDLKEALAGHLDALWDMVGRSVALELISTKIHASKHSRHPPRSSSSSNPPLRAVRPPLFFLSLLELLRVDLPVCS